MRRLSLFLVFCGLLLGGCVPHLSKAQCMSMNWYQIGLNDGTQGKFQRNLAGDIQDCAKFNLSVSVQQYRKGWIAGTRQYCVGSRAYGLGVNGQTYNHICPGDLAKSFDRSWRRGLRKYCTTTTGYELGRVGKPLPNFCAPNQAASFRNAYQRGFQRHLAQANIQNQINNLNGHINDLNAQIYAKKRNIKHMRRMMVRGLDPATKKPLSKAAIILMAAQIADDYIAINNLQHQIGNLQGERAGLNSALLHAEAR